MWFTLKKDESAPASTTPLPPIIPPLVLKDLEARYVNHYFLVYPPGSGYVLPKTAGTALIVGISKDLTSFTCKNEQGIKFSILVSDLQRPADADEITIFKEAFIENTKNKLP